MVLHKCANINLKLKLKYLETLIADLRQPSHKQHGPAARAAGGDDPQPCGLVHAHSDQDHARPRAQDHHDDDHQQRQRLYQRGTPCASVRIGRSGERFTRFDFDFAIYLLLW